MKAWYDHYSTLTIILSQVSATSAQTTSSLLPSSVKHPLLVTVTSNTKCLSTEILLQIIQVIQVIQDIQDIQFIQVIQYFSHQAHSSKSSLTHCITDLFSAL